jgi:hypothetical protein
LAENLNIVVTSKPVDGLLYYSYEYCSYLNDLGINSRVVIICHKNFSKDDYINAISTKYIHCKNVEFDSYQPSLNDITLVMGRSMITLAWQNFRDYRADQQEAIRRLFSKKVIAVYSENHPADYPKAVEFFSPNQIIDLCDTEVYPNGVGEHFEKTINFKIYKPHTDNIQFKYLFLGTNRKYYETVQKVIGNYSDHGILTYNEDYIDIRNNNVFAPAENLMGMFETYVYTKDTFDPAPRIFQECKYFGKEVIYLRDSTIIDGGSVYWKRDIKQPDVTAIVNAIEKLSCS